MMETQLVLREMRERVEELHKIVMQLIICETPIEKSSDMAVSAVLKYSGLTMERLTDSRKGGLIFYKRILCYILHDYCNMPFADIARKVGLKTHVTARHHVERMRWWMSHPQDAQLNTLTTTRHILQLLGYEKD